MREQTRRPHGDDSGFTLVETVVAMVLLVGMISAVLVLLTQAAQTTSSDRKRIAAANLAAREVEMVRNRFQSSTDPRDVSAAAAVVAMNATIGSATNANALPAGTAGQPLSVDGTPYTVQRQVTWLPLGSAASPCDGGSAVNHPGLAVRVTVTWPAMAGVAPVVSDTVLTPPKGLLNSTAGFAAVRVLNRDGAPAVAAPVTVAGPGGTFSASTGADGCAVVRLEAAGAYTVSLNQTGFVSPSGVTVPTDTRTVSGGQVQVYTLTYDRASGLSRTFAVSGAAPDTGTYALPQTLPGLTIGNANLPSDGRRPYPAGTASVPNLFPWPEGYTVWAGTCPDADPAASPSLGSRTVSGGATRGQTDAVVLPLRPVKVSVVSSAPRLVATSTSTTCPGGDAQLQLGRGAVETAGGFAVLRTSLPPGTWRIRAQEEDGTFLASREQTVAVGQSGLEVVLP